jgi:peroxiredoxin
MNKFLSLVIAVITSLSLSAKQGYEIKIKASCIPNKKITLAYHYGNKQYIEQEATSNSKGEVVFKGKEKLNTGLYILVFPEKKAIDIIIEEQFFSIEVPCSDNKIEENNLELYSGITIKGSDQNTSFFSYLSFLELKRQEQKLLNEKIKFYKKSKDFKRELKKAEENIAKLSEQVEAKQEKIIAKFKGKMLSKFLLAQQEVKIPESHQKYQKKYGKDWKYYYFKHHYWDNIDFSFEGLLYSPVLFSKSDYYIEKLTIQTPDSVFAAVDFIIQKAKSNKKTFKYFVIEMLNKYAKSKIVCFDAVYVKIANKYYKSGIADWVDEEQLKKVIRDADNLSKILCGQNAPKIVSKTENYNTPSLYKVNSKYTVVVFWRTSASSTKKMMKALKPFYTKYKNKGVVIYSVETGSIKEWKKYTQNEVLPWINLHKTNVNATSTSDYNVRSVPKIFILDENKKILVKRISASQLSKILDQLLEREKK